jgi:hypothetical protein
MRVGEEVTREQVSRILQSETFRTSEVLRRLLKFLADKSLSGEADQLKEYTIGIDAMGKPPEYDPRQDSVVRIQVGRLRQKLAEYYRSEGKDDPVMIDLPKGHFRLSWQERPKVEPRHNAPIQLTAPSVTSSKPSPRRMERILAVALGLTVIWGIYCTVRLRRERPIPAPASGMWTSEMEELWRPILGSSRPLIISPQASLFVGLQGFGFYRDPSLNHWEDVLTSPDIEKIRKALNNPAILPVYRFTGYGTMTALFRLGRLLGFGGPNTSIVRGDQLSWQQLVDNNVLFLGPPRLNAEQLRSLPIELEFELNETGLRNRHPKQGEPALLADHYPSIRKGTENVVETDNGEVYALITHTPGPLGIGDIECFNSNLSPGTMAAVQAFTAPALVETIVSKLRKSDGRLPPYYQIVLDVKFKDGVPTEIRYLMHHELHAETRQAKQG